MIGGEAWGPVLGAQASEGHIVIGEGSKRGGESRGDFEPKLLCSLSFFRLLDEKKIRSEFHFFCCVSL